VLRPRLIPILLLRNGRLVKGQFFRDHAYVGDLVNTIKIFNEKAVDEIVILDITHGSETGPDYELLAAAANEAFVPISYGGRIDSVQAASKVIHLGIEKIVFGSAVLHDTDLIQSCVQEFGSSTVVACINFLEQLSVYNYQDGSLSHHYVPDLCRELINLGVGELLLQDVGREGTKSGPRLGVLTELHEIAEMIPVVYSGGVCSLDHCSQLWKIGFDIGAGSWFVHQGKNKAVLISYPKYEDRLAAVSLALGGKRGG
jgi:imidazole glycerol-phosphate synthase subunit HisF